VSGDIQEGTKVGEMSVGEMGLVQAKSRAGAASVRRRREEREAKRAKDVRERQKDNGWDGAVGWGDRERRERKRKEWKERWALNGCIN
jgi:hypothetical protein